MSTHEHDTRTPTDLLPVAAAVDELAARERASVPASLEDRVFMATWGTIARAGRGPGQGTVVVRRTRFLTHARLAAAVAICGAGLALLMAQLGRTSPPAHSPAGLSSEIARLEEEVELLLVMRTPA